MCEICNNSDLHVNVRQYDPTHTLTLRNSFVSKMNARFKRVAAAVTEAVVDKDCFGLKEPEMGTFAYVPGYRAFAYLTKAEKITAFVTWLRQVEDAVILEMQYDQQLHQNPWSNLYLAHAFQQGTKRAQQEVLKAGRGRVIETPDGMVLINPMQLEKLQVIFTRAFSDLRGITNSMDEQISRILAQGLFDGQAPKVLAKMINSAIIGGGESLGMDIKYIDKAGRRVSYFMPGRRRAEILARTEIIRAHHVATISEYRNWEVYGVYILAEWATAGDARVCPECDSLQGTIWSLDEIENLIPLHPQCRCIALPYVDKTRTKQGGE